MLQRFLPIALLLLCAGGAAVAQSTGGEPPSPPDTTYTTEPDYPDTLVMEPDIYVDYEPDVIDGYAAGLYAGFTAEKSGLDLAKLDPQLTGTLVMYGGEYSVLIGDWYFNFSTVGSHMYDLGSTYDQFLLDYSGYGTGYETSFFKNTFTFRIGAEAGTGTLKLIKRTTHTDSTGHDLLEAYRREDFFYLRPSVSIGVPILQSPLASFLFRVAGGYMMAFGPENARDLNNFSYGAHLMFAVRMPSFNF
ncbi:MAG: hypothetical protein DYG96_04460 [Chlorobi bacterium CHB2]|nr:hypothetical protein [Chlorobi bacterium CHB2]